MQIELRLSEVFPPGFREDPLTFSQAARRRIESAQILASQAPTMTRDDSDDTVPPLARASDVPAPALFPLPHGIRQIGLLDTLWARSVYAYVDAQFPAPINLRGVSFARVAIHAFSEAAGLPVNDIVGPSRLAHIVAVRQMAMYKTRRATNVSFPRIGRVFGNRDHTTIIHAVRMCEGAGL